MLRWLAIFGMFLAVLGSNCRAGQVQAKDGYQQPATPIPMVSQQQDGANLNSKQAKQDIHANVEIINPPQKDFYDKAPVWINLTLVVVALGTGIVIGFQSIETRRAAQAAEVAARAALKQADHIANTERAWLIPKITQPNDRDVMSLNIREDSWTLPIEVTFTNLGKTPAVGVRALMEASSEKIVGRTRDVAPTLILGLREEPLEYKYRKQKGDAFTPGSIYAPSGKISIYLEIEREFLLGEKEDWELEEKCLCIKGFIEYKDRFGSYATRFCYAYQDVRGIRARAIRSRFTGEARRDREFRKAKPDSYNKID